MTQIKMEQRKGLITAELNACREGAFSFETSYQEQFRHIIYYAKKESWDTLINDICTSFRETYPNMASSQKEKALEFLVDLCISLKSKLIQWHLHKEIGQNKINRAYDILFLLLTDCLALDDSPEKALCARIRKESQQRIQAEAQEESDSIKNLEDLIGHGLKGYVIEVISLIKKSNFASLSSRNLSKEISNYYGNDYGAFLKYTLWFGATFQTTNPPLVKMAWDLDEPANIPVFKQLVEDHYIDGLPSVSDNIDELYSLYVLTIIERNCQLLRDIFLNTLGEAGFVCYQVSPRYHDNPDAMEKEILFVYDLMEKRFGGVPNLSFKLPGTRAGLETAGRISPRGISLTITMCFSLFQALEFAKVFKKGNSIASFLVIMNGRLAFPVRDELKAKGVTEGEEASKLAGVEITRRLFKKLYSPESEKGLGCDPGRVRILNASLRIYDGSIPDMCEIEGTSAITVFPNARYAYDQLAEVDGKERISNATAADTMDILKESELFRQAWWTPGDGPDFKPASELSLVEEKDEEVLSWPPIADTLSQFIGAYKSSVTTIENILK